MPAGRVVLVHRISSISLELNILAAGASMPCTPPHSEEDCNIAGWRLLWWSMVIAKLRSCLDRNVFLTDVGFLWSSSGVPLVPGARLPVHGFPCMASRAWLPVHGFPCMASRTTTYYNVHHRTCMHARTHETCVHARTKNTKTHRSSAAP